MSKRGFLITSLAILTAISLLAFSPIVRPPALHSVMLSVPDYSEEALTWCGPATAQMIMDGYPSGGCSVLQEDIWLEIQDNKTESEWDTDPQGLKEAMKHLCPPSGTWSVFSNTNAQTLMYSVAYFMTSNNYPVAALLNTQPHNDYIAHAEHWVVIRGIVTDQDPTPPAVTSVNLEFVWINDPSPATLGDPSVERYISGSTWYSEFEPVTKATSSYSGKYVAVIEPPRRRGRAVAAREVMSGRVITPRRATQYAAQWIERYKLYEMKPYKILREARPLKPLLVNKKHGGYYIIPYALEQGSRQAHAALLLNAYKGNLQEVGKFKPVQYILRKKAIDIARKHLKVERPRKVETELIYNRKEGIGSKYFPQWKVTLDDKVLYVNRKGKIFIRKALEGCIDFEDPPLGTTYRVGSSFIDSGARITIQRFQWSDGRWTDRGYARIGNRMLAGGSGQEAQVNNVNLSINFGGPIRGLKLLFGEFGGNLNIRINREFKNFENFADIDGTTIGGVAVSVSNGHGRGKGILKLTGNIQAFAIGGQELAIDDICTR